MNLQAFCHATRDGLTSPWSAGEWSLAADGRVLVRVPRRAEVPESEHAPKPQRIAELFAAKFAPEPVPIPLPLPPLHGPRDCVVCDGEKTINGQACDYCDGTGKLDENMVRVHIAGSDWNHIYLHKLVALPGLKFFPAPAETHHYGHARFTFDGGGEGLLMPMREVGA
jgi:hypothetical protein